MARVDDDGTIVVVNLLVSQRSQWLDLTKVKTMFFEKIKLNVLVSHKIGRLLLFRVRARRSTKIYV